MKFRRESEVEAALRHEQEITVVHPHTCPKCRSTSLTRVSTFEGEFEQPLRSIENYYGGAIGLRAVVAEGAPKKDTRYGVKTARLRCDECGYESSNLLHFAEVQSG